MDKNGKKQILFYMHAGSGNHGCEAIAVSTMKLLEDSAEFRENFAAPVIATNNSEQDLKYYLKQLSANGNVKLIEDRHIDRHKLAHIMYYVYRKVTGDAESFYRYRYKDATDVLGDTKGDIAVSIGGDNYCYPGMIKDLILSHNVFRQYGMKTVLMGCSVEPETVPGLILDLNAYDRIIARETITYEGLIAGGVDKDRLSLCPDPAFVLPVDKTVLPPVFAERSVIGLNVSPMARDNESGAGLTMDNYRCLIKHILDNTEYGIALIPHVVWNSNDDRGPLSELMDEFMDIDSGYRYRITLIEDRTASELKYIIGQCKAFVGARTHATIAAYSQCIPTLVLGYSVKSRGIARDLFGTDENYVIPVQSLKNSDDLVKGYEWMMEREEEIRKKLDSIMPEYKERAVGNISFIHG